MCPGPVPGRPAGTRKRTLASPTGRGRSQRCCASACLSRLRAGGLGVDRPGRGAIDLPAVLREIRKTEYTGFVTVELYPYTDNPDQAGREAKAYLDGLLAGLE